MNAIHYPSSFVYPNNGTLISKLPEANLLPNSERASHAGPFGYLLVSAIMLTDLRVNCKTLPYSEASEF